MKNLGGSHENLDQQIYLALKQMILERQLLPGEKIAQERLAQELGVSRTPLINALKGLEREKLIEALPRRGFFVRQFTPEEMISIFELREVLEGLSARRAATALTDRDIPKLEGFFSAFPVSAPVSDVAAYSKEDRRFHHYISQIGSKEFLRGVLESFNVISFSYQHLSTEGLVRHPNETLHEHLAIITAICDRDADTAESLMRAHLRRAADELRIMVADGG